MLGFGSGKFKKQNEIIEQQQATLREFEGKFKKMEGHICELAESLEARQNTGLGNKYKTVEAQVKETIAKFNGESEYGCELVQRIVGLYSALTLPNGVDVQVDPAKNDNGKNKTTGRAELEYIRNWLDENNLDQAGALDLAQEAHLQGRVLMTLDWEKSNDAEEQGRVIGQYRSWIDTNYEIDFAGKYKAPPYTVSGSESVNEESDEFEYENDRFSFLLLNGRFGQLEGRPRVGPILNVLENLSADLADWREGNKFFGHKTPYFECENAAEADTVNEYLQKVRWRVGMALAGTAKFDLVDGGGSDHLAKSIETNISIISAATGISPHFLGCPQLLSNRSTADAMGEPTEIVTKSEAKRWYNFFEDLFYKIIELRNKNVNNGQTLDPTLIKPKIVGLSDRQVTMIKEILLPALKSNALSVKTFINQLPLELDPDEEYERIQQQQSNVNDNIFMPESGFSGNKTPVDDEDE